uniref:DUF4435 domain-containing protein n=1 Tax=Prevotella sp. TaxID=59823 RepID=UPI004028ED4C
MVNVTPKLLKSKTIDFAVCKQKYLLKKNQGKIICFVEGKYDSDYYLDKFRNHLGDGFEIIVCSNKKNVLKAYSEFYDSDHKKVKMGFFTDNDFDEDLNNPLIFVTDRYSIENYYCSISALNNILLYGLKIQNNSEVNDVIAYYQVCANKFHQIVAEFNSFYSIIKMKQRQNNVTYKICLENHFPSKFAEIDVDNCIKKYNLVSLLAEYSLPSSLISQEEVDNEIRKLMEKDPFNSFRGKYELEFTIKFITKIKNEANQKIPSSKVKQKISATINNVCFMSDYAQYADIAEGLIDYLQKIKVGL